MVLTNDALFCSTHQAAALIPVLLFKLGREKNPSVARALLQSLSNLGTHKVL